LRKRGHSASVHQEKLDHEQNVNGNDEESDEAIRLSKFSGGYVPDPHTPRKIESLDWPGPPYPPAVPELRNRSRSSSNRHAQNNVQSVNGNNLDEIDSDKENEIKPKPYNNLFDNDYYNYLLRFKSYKDWHKLIEKNKNRDKEELAQADQRNNSNSQHEDVLDDEEAKGKYPRRLKLDPWKASRTPSASIEPKVRTRYESPVNASPSRMCRSSTYMSNTSGYNLSRMSNGTNSAVYIDISNINPNTSMISSSTPQNNPKSATLPIQKQQISPHQVPHQTFYDPTNNSSYRLISTPITGN
jgi:hypothetical protein